MPSSKPTTNAVWVLQLDNDEKDTFYAIKAQLEVEKAFLKDEIRKIFNIIIY